MTVRSDSEPASPAAVDATVDRLASMVRGEGLPLEWAAGALDAATLDAAERHGVLPLLADRLHQTAGTAARHAEVAARARRLATADLVREAELHRLLLAFDQAGLPALIFKGAQVAYTVYARPDLRPRLDSDVLVRPASREAADAVLVAAGYERVEQFSGDLVTYQACYRTRRQDQVAHVVDLHWRLANPQQFGSVLAVEEMFAAAVPVPALGAAKGLGPVHALVVACVHPIAHHRNARLLIWSHDVHLLAGRLTPADWEAFAALADARGVASVCAHSLDVARGWFHTEVPPPILTTLRAPQASAAASARYLAPRRRHIETVWSDLWTLQRWGDRRRLVLQHVFPSRDYMRRVYAPASAAPLPLLYARRAVRGALRWLART